MRSHDILVSYTFFRAVASRASGLSVERVTGLEKRWHSKGVSVSGISELFDVYGRNARLYPAVLLMVPLVALPGVLNGVERLSSGIAMGIVSVALLYGLTHWIRTLGKRAELRLVAKWGGLPTTRWLLWHDHTLDSTTKRRYHNYLRASGLEMPTIQEERADAAGSRERLASAVTWLRNNRRGEPHKILHGENAAYGFRRNLYGAKPVGVAISLTAAGISGWAVFVAAMQIPAPTFVEILVSIPLEARIGLVVSLASLFAWVFVVTQNWVLEAAELYAKALLETCDTAAG